MLCDTSRKVETGCWKEETCQAPLPCLRLRQCLPVGPWLMALLQPCSWRQQLEEKFFCTGNPDTHRHRFHFFFPSTDIVSSGADYYRAEMYFHLKSGVYFVFGVPLHLERYTPLQWDRAQITIVEFFQNVVTCISTVLYVFIWSFVSHIFQQFREMQEIAFTQQTKKWEDYFNSLATLGYFIFFKR